MIPTCKYLDFLAPFQLSLENPGLTSLSGGCRVGAWAVLAVCQAQVQEPVTQKGGRLGVEC